MGLCIDVFSNTPGVAAASATFLGFLQPYLLEIFTPRESPEDLLPTMKSLGTVRYINYTIICTWFISSCFSASRHSTSSIGSNGS